MSETGPPPDPSVPRSGEEGPEIADGESAFPRPRIVVSRCLDLEPVRYNGAVIRTPLVGRLEPFVDLVGVCPEVEVGLGVPRDPIRLVRGEGATLLVQPTTGRDLTADMRGFSTSFLEGLPAVDGFLLKSRSPSCGIDGVKVYAAPEKAPPVDKEPGMFAAAVLERFPHHPVEHEGRLTNLRIRDHFLTSVFALADVRRTRRADPSMSALVDLQARHKLALMAVSPSAQRELGRVGANHDRRRPAEVWEAYEDAFRRALTRPASAGTHVNVIQHAQGYFKDRISPAEKRHFLRLQEEYRTGRVPRGALLSVLQSWIVRFDEGYLARQSYFRPYPRDLFDLTDSGGSGSR